MERAAATTLEKPDPVRLWRLEQLLRAGYPPEEARLLSASGDVDVHLAADLLRSGCSVETAVRILR